MALKLGGGERGRRGGGAAPPPRRASACHPLSPAYPPGHTRAVGVAGRLRASGAVRSAANESVGGGGGGPGPVRAPAFPGPASEEGRSVCAVLGAACPPSAGSRQGVRALASAVVPGCSGLFGGGLGPLFCLRPLLGLRGRGGGSRGGTLVPWRRPLTAEGGRPGGPGPRGQPSAGGSHSSAAPLYLGSDPRAGPCWGPSLPLMSSRGAGRPGAALRVSGQRLAGCGAVGSPPRSLSPHYFPREVARAPPSRCIVGGGVGWGAQLPPPLSCVRCLRRHLRRRLCGGLGCGGGGLRRR